MRNILILIFGLLSFSGSSQIAAMLMTEPEAADATYLLDDYPADAAYSLRLLKADQIDSAAIRVRRSSDNAEQDIGFTSEGYLDTASLKTFVGANSGYVVTWYDQSGSEFDLTQAVAASQPLIVNSGTVQRIDGDVAIKYFDTALCYLENDSILGRSVFYPFFVTNANTDTDFIHFVGTNIATANYSYVAQDGSSSTTLYTNFGTPTLYVNNSTPSITTRDDVHTNHLGNKIIAYANGSTTSWTEFRLNGYNGASSFRFIGYYKEVVIYFSDQDSNRSAIFGAINSHYSTY